MDLEFRQSGGGPDGKGYYLCEIWAEYSVEEFGLVSQILYGAVLVYE